MSDDKYLGRVCWRVPRRLFCLVLAALVCGYGAFGLFRVFILGELPGNAGAAAWNSKDRCVGHGCNDMLTCNGMREGTFHVREVIMIFGFALFGYWGLLGALHVYTADLKCFSWFLSMMVVLLLGVALADGAYTLVCGAYPLNVVDEALLWPLPHLPVRDVVKIELRDAMVAYPVAFVNRLAKLNVFGVYLLVEVAASCFYTYAAQQVMMLAQFGQHGSLGLGAIYNIRDWRDGALVRRGVDPHYGSLSAA